MNNIYDVIVAGGGHAGCEAAHAAAKLGARTLLVTMNLNTIAQMSCNPAMGGVAKGQIVREIDALGGLSGVVSDASTLQFRMLNRSKGPAMWSPRTQNDRAQFAQEWRNHLEHTQGLFLWQDTVVDLLTEGGKLVGVKTQMGIEFHAPAVIVTSGTFLNGIIHIGEQKFGGGRTGERAAHGLTEVLNGLGFAHGRMKTGTPPRVDAKSLDFSQMERQDGDDFGEGPNAQFSYFVQAPKTEQLPCWIAHTSEEVHEVLRTGFDRSPMYTGRIQGLGPRYCPSIEDKINRFAERNSHQLFIEPEGRHSTEMYINGFSTSLPLEVQYEALRRVKGFENVHMLKPGYAIEYDYFPPTQLLPTLETKLVEGLYLAGQVKGTTGYEEAACQGLMAGINAARKIQGLSDFTLKRSEAYIGVLIDDLITKGTDEPYRMFTSRAEYRILLRQDNADMRLAHHGHALGLLPDAHNAMTEAKRTEVAAIAKYLKRETIGAEAVNPYLVSLRSAPVPHGWKLDAILARPEVSLSGLMKAVPGVGEALGAYSESAIEQAEIALKYGRYLEKEREMAQRMGGLDEVPLPQAFDYLAVPALSHEAKEKLRALKPASLGQASRVSGITPADISVLMVYLGR